jgi:hypothetical protein
MTTTTTAATPTRQTDRAAFRHAVREIAAKAKETLPECTGRVDSAVKLVLAGDVELLDGGQARVASQANGTTQYFVVNGTCECRDFVKAPSGWCKHRIAAGLAKRVAARLRAPGDAPANGHAPAPTAAQAARAAAAPTAAPSPAADAPAGQPAPAPPLPEAPVSVNVYLELGGRQVQLTLRGTDERAVLARLEAVLQRFPLPATPADTTPQCPSHGPLKPSTKGKGWYCPAKLADGSWCKGR